jgi:hypothetical protein
MLWCEAAAAAAGEQPDKVGIKSQKRDDRDGALKGVTYLQKSSLLPLT